MTDTLGKITIKRKPAAEIARCIRDSAVADLRRYGTTSRMRDVYGLSRSDVQDLVLLGLMEEIRRLRPLQRRRKGARAR